jgi:hypothetical protein
VAACAEFARAIIVAVAIIDDLFTVFFQLVTCL